MRRIFIFLLGLYLLISWGLLYLFTREDRIAHAVIGMTSGLILFWVSWAAQVWFCFAKK